MPIIEPVIRPPSEADSFLLQVSCGCSSNSCSFCGAYLGKSFKIKDPKEIFEDIEAGSMSYPWARKVFLLDGDALALKNEMLVPVLERIGLSFPRLTRISSYANGYNITNRSAEQLKELADSRLNLIYIGLESGSQDILDICGKQSTVKEMITAVRNAELAGIKSSVIVLLGLGGRMYAEEHVRQTVKALNLMQPRLLSFLSLMLIPGTALYESHRRGEFEMLNSSELLEQAYNIIAGLELNKTVFRTDHASNYLSLEGRFPHDKGRLLDILSKAIRGKINLRPEFFRGL